MTVYLLNILITCVLAQIGKYRAETRGENSISWAFILPMLSCWILMMALRDTSVGSDTAGYFHTYNNMCIRDVSLEDFLLNKRDVLFYTFEYVVGKLFKGNWFVFQIFCGILIYLPVLAILRENVENYSITCLLFIFSGNLYSGYNGLRQAIAISLLFWAFSRYLKNYRYVLFGICCLIAYGFHATVIFVIPFMFLCLTKLNSKMIKSVFIFMIFSYIFLWGLWQYIIQFFELIGQEKLAADYSGASANGSSFLRFLMYLLPIIPSLIGYPFLKEEVETVDVDILVTAFSAIFMLFSTKYWLFGRVAGYFNLPALLLLPQIKYAFAENSRKFYIMLVLLLYFVFMCASMLRGEGGIYPYQYS